MLYGFPSHQKNLSLYPSLHNYKTICVSQISSAFQSPTTPFPTTTNLVPHPFPSLIKILKASSVSLLSQKPTIISSTDVTVDTNKHLKQGAKENKQKAATQQPTSTREVHECLSSTETLKQELGNWKENQSQESTHIA